MWILSALALLALAGAVASTLAYLRQRNFTFAIATQCFTNFAYMGGFVITPVFLQSVFGYPETTGIDMLPLFP